MIAFQDLLHVGECFILPGDGSSHTRGTLYWHVTVTEILCMSWMYTIHFTVKFRAIVFRPFIGEVLVGKIRRCSPEGVHGELLAGTSTDTPEYL